MSTTFGTRALEEPLSYVAEAATGFDDGGYVFKLDGSGNAVAIAAITDAPEAVLVDGTKDATTGSVKLGEPITGMRHGIVPVRSEAVTWVSGDIAYLHTNGHVTNVDGGSASKLGRYVPPDGETGETVAAAGEKVQVDLDSGGSALHA